MNDISVLFQSVLMLWGAVAGLAYIVGGQKAAGKVVTGPVKFVGKLVLDFITGVAGFIGTLTGQGLRFCGRQLNRGARHVLRLPPPPAPAAITPRRRREDDEAEDEED